MINFPSDTKVYLSLGATDMRKTINGLSVIVSEQMQLDQRQLFFGWQKTPPIGMSTLHEI